MTTSNARKDSPNRHADVTVQGKRLRLSTGLTDKKQADAVSATLSGLAKNILTPSQEKLKRLCGAVFDAAGVVPFWEREATKEVLFDSWRFTWLAGHTHLSSDLHMKYRGAMSSFALRYGNKPVRDIKPSDVKLWSDKLAETNSPATVQQKVGLLAVVLEDAVLEGLLTANPARRCKPKGGATVEREALTDEQIERLENWLMHSTAPHRTEWLVAIRLARWNGLRLMDAVNIMASNITETPNGSPVLDFICSKTKQRMVVPLHPRAADVMANYGFCGRIRLKSKSQLSQTFTAMMERIGIENPITVSQSGRKLRSLSFHSLRHRFVTWLEESGVPEDVRMRLAGHSSRRVHAGYSHVDPIQEAEKLRAW